jgi:hypothetical protein
MESRTQPNLREEASILRNDFSDLPLIFDLDGTLVDSANQMYRALNMACIEADVDLIPK